MIPLFNTPMRRQFEFLTRNGADPCIFLRQVSISFGERVHPDIVRRAWDVVATATPLLRDATSEVANGSDTEDSTVEKPVPRLWTVLDWTGKNADSLGQAWSELLVSDAAKPFDAGPSQRIKVLQLPGDDMHILWTSDARDLDYSSLAGTLIRWFAACDLIGSGQAAEWPVDPDPTAYLERLTDRPISGDKEFWKSYFARFEAPNVPVLFPLPSQEDAPIGSRASVSHTFERIDRLGFGDGSESSGVSVAALARAAWAFLVAEVCGTRDIVITETVEADADSVLAQTAGRFEACLPRRIKIPSGGTIGEFLSDCDAWNPGSAKHFAPAAIAEAAEIDELDLIPSAAFVYRDGTLNDTLRRSLPRWMAADVCIYEKATHPLTLTWTDTDRPSIELGFDPAKFTASAAESLLARWVQLVKKFCEFPEEKISTLSVLLPEECETVTGTELRTAARSLVPQCVHETFNDIATERSDQPAIELGVETVLYSKLTSQSNQLARYLQKNGVVGGDAVGLAVGRSTWWVLGLLGIWKAGGIVVLLAPDKSGTKGLDVPLKAVISDAATASIVDVQDGIKRITIDTGWSAISGEKTRALSVATEPDSPAVIARDLEKPDAWVTLSHSQLLAACSATVERLGISAEDRLLQFAPVDLPIAVEEIFSAFLAGATLVLRPDDVLSTRTAFHEFVRDARISLLVLPSAFWGQWLHYLTELSATAPETVRLVVLHGWRILPPQMCAWEKVSNEIPLFHATPNRGLLGLGFLSNNIPFGAIASPVVARIINPDGVALPPGFCGAVECAVSKAGDKTHTPDFTGPGVVAFRTPDGRFLAREWVDTQLGNFSRRQSLAAIEWVASQHPGISAVVAGTKAFDNADALCVWIVPQDTLRGEPLDFRDYLGKHLPSALVPSRVGCMQRLPLTRTGVVDLAALPEPNSDVPEFSSKQERGSDEEEQLRGILSKVLGGRMIRLDEMIRDGKARPQVAASMCETVAQAGFSVETADFAAPFSVRSLLRNVRSRRPLTESGWVPLKPLRMSGGLPPLVIIHDFSGSSRVCESLAVALGEDQPCYAITARGHAEPAVCHTSIEEMARAYVDAIKVMDPEGPHSLVGIGFGGLVAFECARILTADGITPRMLAVLRTEPPVTSSAVRSFRALSRNFLKTFRGSGRHDSQTGKAAAPNPVAEANREAAARFAPDQIADFEMHIFVPEDEFSSFREVQAGWNTVCSNASFYQVPCTAQELLEEPAVTAVGDALRKLMHSEEIQEEPEDEGMDGTEDRAV